MPANKPPSWRGALRGHGPLLRMGRAFKLVQGRRNPQLVARSQSAPTVLLGGMCAELQVLRLEYALEFFVRNL